MPPIPLHELPIARFLKQCQRVGCMISEGDLNLLCCSRCRTCYYCSKTCQTADWQRHKAGCAATTESRAFAKTSGIVYNGHSLADVDRRLKMWTQVHRPLISTSAVHALASKPNEYLWKTHALCIILEPKFANSTLNKTDMAKQISTSFEVKSAPVLPLEVAFSLGTVTANSEAVNAEVVQEALKNVKRDREAYVYSTITLLLIPPLNVIRMIPDGYREDFNIMEAEKKPDWEFNLKRMVRLGIVL